jgi:hypothetical protein
MMQPACRRRKANEDLRDHMREPAIRLSWNRVRLVQKRGRPERLGGEDRRCTGKAAHREHRLRRTFPENFLCFAIGLVEAGDELAEFAPRHRHCGKRDDFHA